MFHLRRLCLLVAATAAVLTVGVALLPAVSQAGTTDGFVRRSGTALTLGGVPWRFVGFNDYRLTTTPGSPGACGAPMSDAEVAAEFDQIRTTAKANAVRTWFFQSLGGPGNWAAFDRVLNLAASRGLKVVPVLVDQGGTCEPAVRGRKVYKDPAWFTSGYRSAGDGYPLAYRDFVAQVARRYRGSPTVAFWQLGNELESSNLDHSCDPSVADPALKGFAEDIATRLHGVDPNHLVSLGTMGGGQCGSSGSIAYRNLHAGAIDLCEYHDYGHPLAAMPGDQWNGLQVRINDCGAVNKPIFVGEAGLPAGTQGDGSTGQVTAASISHRAALFDQKLSVQFRAGIQGFLVWSRGPADGEYQVDVGDPLDSVLARYAWTAPGVSSPTGPVVVRTSSACPSRRSVSAPVPSGTCHQLVDSSRRPSLQPAYAAG